MLKVELGLGASRFPLDLFETQLNQLLAIPCAFILNPAKKDQVDSFQIWGLKSPLMLITVLRSWQRRQIWCRQILSVLLTEDATMTARWDLRVTYVNETVLEGFQEETLELTNIVPAVDFEVQDREEKALQPIDFNRDEIEFLISNIGTETPLA